MTLEEALKRLEWKAQDLKKFSDDGRYMGLRSELSSGTCYELGVEILQEIAAIKEALAQQSNEQGCEHCNHSLYCGTKCKNCGKQSNEQVEPVAWRSPNWGHSMDEWVYRDADDPVLTVDGKPSPSNEPLFAHPPVPTAQPKEPEQESVAWIVGDDLTIRADWVECLNWKRSWVDVGRAIPNQWTPVLYTTPPQRKPLTDEQIKEASLKAGMQEHYMGFHSGFIRFARALEAAHGIKE